MKKFFKYLIFIVLISIIILLYFLINKQSNKINFNSSLIKNIPCIKLIEKDSNFELYSNCEDTFDDYFYRIYDKNNEIIDEQYIKKETTIIRKNDIVEVRINYGTSAVISKFYNINDRKDSKFFQDILLYNETFCVYFENDRLVVQDLFDKNKFYKSIKNIEYYMINSMENLEFIENNTYLKITYLCNDELNCQEIIIPIK